MLAQGSYMMATVKQQNPKIDQGLLAPITVDQDKAKYEGVHTTTFLLGVAEKSKHKEAAKKFLTFLADPKISSEYANATGQLLTVKDVKYDSPELKESAKWKDKKTVFQPRFTILNERVSKAVETSVQDVLSGMSAKKAAEKAQGEVERVAKN
jgi:raffinose/stachyose/melibiose transport system substrate-binding protein